jgi:hypothetical protein
MGRRVSRARGGYTLLEVTIALALWMLISLAVVSVWRYSAHASAGIIERTHAFENARAVLDVMLMNIQLNDEIRLSTHSHFDPLTGEIHENTLRSMRLFPGYVGYSYALNTFFFDAGLPPEHLRHGRVERSGAGNELARGIALVQVVYVPGTRIDIRVTTACELPVVLNGSACVRRKNVVLVT